MFEAWWPSTRALAAATAAATLAELVAALDELRREKELSYARLGRRALAVRGFSRTTAHAVITGRRALDEDVLRGFLYVCRVSADEYLRWLDAFHRLGSSDPQPTVVHPAKAPPSRALPIEREAMGERSDADQRRPDPVRIDWPTLDDVRLKYPRAIKPAPDNVHRSLPWLLVPGIAAPVIAIGMTWTGVPVSIMLGLFVMGAISVAIWTLQLTGTPDRPHRPKTSHHFDFYEFDDGLQGVVPVIGE
ncbi:hypothetical protein ACFXGA_18685 [Actinosynnema sp. NPDC059335]|uniref:hypothetical protein n=1 Tax=Actinosynnema sp. NPDC059335 TaxID=3346804 RepID=UPI00366E4D6C